MASILFLLASLSLAFLCICQADLVSDVCSEAFNPRLCTQTLRSDPRSRGADLPGLGQIIIEKSEAATKHFIEVVKSFSNVKTKNIVDTCVETSNDAIDGLKECSQYFKGAVNKSDFDLQNEVTAAMTDVGTCDDEFEITSEPSEVKKASKRAQDLIGVLLTIANKL